MKKNSMARAYAATPSEKGHFSEFLKTVALLVRSKNGVELIQAEVVLCAAEDQFISALAAWKKDLRKTAEPLRKIESIIDMLGDVCSDLSVICQTFRPYLADMRMGGGIVTTEPLSRDSIGAIPIMSDLSCLGEAAK